MISLREKTFETNSSSCHSITFSTDENEKYPLLKGFEIDLIGTYWGWEPATYTDMESKFSYWFNAFIENTAKKLQSKDIEAKEAAGIKNVWQTPITETIYTSMVEEAANHLEAVLKAFETEEIKVNIVPSDSKYEQHLTCDQYIEEFKKKNSQPPKRKYNDYVFDYIVVTGSGIDHQSGPGEDTDCKKLAEFSPAEVVKWVLGNGWFSTGNDNG